MPPYRAQRQSLYGNVGGPADTGVGAVDYAAIIDSIAQGSGSLIQQAYLRRMNERNMAIAADERKYAREQDAITNAREDRRDNREEFDRAAKRANERAELVFKGFHEGEHREPTGATLRMPTGRGFGQFRSPGAITRMLTGGSAAKNMAPAETEDVEQTRVTQEAGPHFDLDKSVPYRQATDKAAIEGEIRGSIAAQNNATKIAVEMLRGQARIAAVQEAQKNKISILQFQAGLRKGTPQSLAQLNNMRVRMADGLLERFSVPSQSMEENLGHALKAMATDPEIAAEFRAAGVTSNHLSQAFAIRNRAATQQAFGAATTSGELPDEAAGRRAETGAAVVGGAATRDSTAKANWAKKNPPKPGESYEDYQARFNASRP